MEFLRELMQINEQDTLDVYPDLIVDEIKKNIRKGAKDLEQKWKNAIELTNQAFRVTQVQIPTPDQTEKWNQYDQLLGFSVEQLARTRGQGGDWRVTTPTDTSSLDEGDKIKPLPATRFFVEIPGMETKELTVDSMDDAIHSITNKFRSRGKKVIVKRRDDNGAVLSVHDHTHELERITIKEV